MKEREKKIAMKKREIYGESGREGNCPLLSSTAVVSRLNREYCNVCVYDGDIDKNVEGEIYFVARWVCNANPQIFPCTFLLVTINAFENVFFIPWIDSETISYLIGEKRV